MGWQDSGGGNSSWDNNWSAGNSWDSWKVEDVSAGSTWKEWKDEPSTNDWSGWNGDSWQGQKRVYDETTNDDSGSKRAKWEEPGTPGGCIPRTPTSGTATTRIPMTPRDPTTGSSGGEGQAIPRTPGNSSSMPVPATPAAAYAGFGGGAQEMAMPVPQTPAAAYMSAAATPGIPARMTPAPVGRVAAATPAAIVSPGTPAGRSPGTPGLMNPATPAGRAPGTPGARMPGTPGLSGSANPATPAGRSPGTPGFAGMANPATPAGRVPGTPAAAPGTPGMRGGFVQRGPRSGLATPVSMGRAGGAMGLQPIVKKSKPRVPTFSDGTHSILRHAPRKERGSGTKTPAPMTPAITPQHWTNPAPFEKKKEEEDPIPDFEAWRNSKKKEMQASSRRRPSQGKRSGHAAAMAPFAEATDRGADAHKLEMAGDSSATPFLGGITPVLNNSAPPGGATPFLQGQEGGITPMLGSAVLPGAETPFLPTGSGEETPLINAPAVRSVHQHQPDDGWTHDAAFRMAVPALAEVVRKQDGLTPRLPQYQDGVTQHLPFKLDPQTPQVPPPGWGEETPLVSAAALR